MGIQKIPAKHAEAVLGDPLRTALMHSATPVGLADRKVLAPVSFESVTAHVQQKRVARFGLDSATVEGDVQIVVGDGLLGRDVVDPATRRNVQQQGPRGDPMRRPARQRFVHLRLVIARLATVPGSRDADVGESIEVRVAQPVSF